MPLQSLQKLAAGSLPQPDDLVMRSRGEALAIRRPRHAEDPFGMTFQGLQMLAVGHVPDPNGVISRRRGEVCTIRRPRDAVYPMCMPAQDLAQGQAGHGRASDFGEGRGLWLFLLKFREG